MTAILKCKHMVFERDHLYKYTVAQFSPYLNPHAKIQRLL